MTKRRKKSLTRQILPGMLAAGVLWGGFAAQAEAAVTYQLHTAKFNGDTAACNNIVTEARNLGKPEFSDAEYAVGYVPYDIAANANGNTLTLNTGAIFSANSSWQFSIYGGKAVGTSSSEANNNTVIVNGGYYEIKELAGGFGPTASYNTVTINNTIGKTPEGNTTDIFTATAIMGGGGTGSGNYDYNTVNINGGTFNVQSIMGGDGSINSDYNTVNINGGTFTVQSIAGGGFSGNFHYNTVNINGGTFSGNLNIYGGSANGGTASGNTVNITGGTFSSLTNIVGGDARGASGKTDNNTVTISGGTFGKYTNIWGGYGNRKADNNTVTISGGSFGDDTNIIGGSPSGTAKNNTVTISGGEFGSGIYLCGGDNAGNSNNTLNLKIKGLTVNSVEGFQNLNFYIPKTAQANETMLTVARSMNLSGATIKAIVQDGSTLKTGDTIYLIKAPNINGYETITTGGTFTDPGYLNYGLEFTATDTEVKATIGSVSGLSAESKSLAETRAGGIAILNDGATLMAGTSLVNAKAAAKAANLSAQGGEGAPAPAGFTPFAAVGANNMRYETGSYVDSKGWGINVGMARELTYKKSLLTIAPVIEYGRSSYDSYLDSGTHGSGKQQFLGAGAIVRQDFTKGPYVEGSLRAGRMKGDYNSGDTNASYDTASNYLGLHLGVGKIVNLDKKNKLDIYGKLFYTKQAGDDVKLSTGAVYNFEAIDSVRTRLGARWTAELAKNSSLYVGLAWDHEFDSKARATYKGFSTPTPSMKGDSCLLELGWQVKPKETSPLSINLNLTGWCGKQKGVQFGAGFEWGF